MLDRAPVSSMTAVFIFLLIVSGVTTGLSNIENWGMHLTPETPRV